ncbi:MAG: hypothetical protein K5867_06890 [Bacteroidales bacterium]|nr:hypothetical protein [Bacteroidales bacterium]
MTKKTGRDTLASQEKPVSTSFTTKIAKLWWLFPLATIIFAALALLTVDGHFAMCLIFCGLSAITLVLQIPVFVILLVKKRWWIAVASFFLTIVSLILFIALPARFVIMYYFGSNFESIEDTDPFGQKHTIPEGMEYNIPLACTTNDGDTIDDGDNEFLGCVKDKPIIDSTDTTSWLQI